MCFAIFLTFEIEERPRAPKHSVGASGTAFGKAAHGGLGRTAFSQTRAVVLLKRKYVENF
jgi:hypothetical protein